MPLVAPWLIAALAVPLVKNATSDESSDVASRKLSAENFRKEFELQAVRRVCFFVDHRAVEMTPRTY